MHASTETCARLDRATRKRDFRGICSSKHRSFQVLPVKLPSTATHPIVGKERWHPAMRNIHKSIQESWVTMRTAVPCAASCPPVAVVSALSSALRPALAPAQQRSSSKRPGGDGDGDGGARAALGYPGTTLLAVICACVSEHKIPTCCRPFEATAHAQRRSIAASRHRLQSIRCVTLHRRRGAGSSALAVGNIRADSTGLATASQHRFSHELRRRGGKGVTLGCAGKAKRKTSEKVTEMGRSRSSGCSGRGRAVA
eukprot:6195367-Pleurochrysis_carterae.AAC.1